MKKTVRVSHEFIEEMFFNNGERHYTITDGLEEGNRLSGIMRDPMQPRDWLFVFEDGEKEVGGEIKPIFTRL